jgi:predicted membrane protein
LTSFVVVAIAYLPLALVIEMLRNTLHLMLLFLFLSSFLWGSFHCLLVLWSKAVPLCSEQIMISNRKNKKQNKTNPKKPDLRFQEKPACIAHMQSSQVHEKNFKVIFNQKKDNGKPY